MKRSIQQWGQQIGFPLIHIHKNGNQIQIKETEFGKSTSNFWDVPIIINNQTLWLQNNSTQFDIEDDSWLTVKSNGNIK